MKEYIIYSRVKDENGKPIVLFLANIDGLDYEFIKKEDECYFKKIMKFPTMNSAIIWWRGFYEWLLKGRGIRASVTKYNPDPIIDIGEITDGNLDYFVAVHRLDLKYGDSPLNEPDEKTLTEEEKREYKRYLENEKVIRGSLAAITADAREAAKRSK